MKIFTIILGLVIVYAILGFFVAPPMIKDALETRLADQLSRPVTVSEVKLNPFVLSLTIHGFEIMDGGARLIGFQELFANVQLVSLLWGELTVHEFRLVAPYGLVKIEPDGHLNLLDLVPPSDSSEADEDQQGDQTNDSEQDDGFPIIITQLDITGGHIEFHDRSKVTPFRADLSPFQIAIRDLSTKRDDEGTYVITAGLDNREVLRGEGRFSITPLRSNGHAALTDIKLHTLWSYLQDDLGFEIRSGLLDFEATYALESRGETMRTNVTEGALRIRNFSLSEKGDDRAVIAVPSLAIQGINVDLSEQRVAIASVQSNDAEFDVGRNPEGQVNYQLLFASQSSEEVPHDEPEVAEADDSETPWSVRVDEIHLENYGITFEDQSVTPPAKLVLHPTTLHLANLQSEPGTPVTVDLTVTVNETGSLGATGTITVHPLAADLDVEISQLALKPFQPYVGEMAHVRVDGATHVKGHVRFNEGEEDEPKIRFTGDARLSDFVAVDTELGETFLKWRSFNVNGLSLDIEPNRVAIEEIVAQQPYARVMTRPDGALSVTTLIKEKPDHEEDTSTQESAAEADPSAEETPTPIQVKAIRIIDGSLNFEDYSLAPIVATGIQQLNGTITGLSSEELARADIDLAGKVDGVAPFTIAGKINPLTSDAFTDITVSFHNAELLVASPYAAKFAGRPINKGKMSIDLSYKLSKNELVAENKVLIDQLTLGEKVESPDATALPVKLAVALLKDRHGRINIDLPVRGNLDDPDFHYGRLLLSVFTNLITKIATSPFAALGSVIGGDGEGFDGINFTAGHSELTSAEGEKLASLAKALEDRPGLRLEVAGATDPDADRRALAELELRERFAKSEQPNDGTNPIQARADRQEPEEKKPGFFIRLFGFFGTKESTAPEDAPLPNKKADPTPSIMSTPESDTSVSAEVAKEELLKTILVDDGMLHQLAQKRASRIRDYLVQQGGISADRVFLVEVNTGAVSEDGNVPSGLTLSAD